MNFAAEDVKKLRDVTGAGFADCRTALTEAKDFSDAVESINKKGVAQAEKVAAKGRETKQGTVASYIHHTGAVGVLLELNCSTDFVARNDEFKNLAKELAIQVAGTNPTYVSFEDIPVHIIDQARAELLNDSEIQKKPAEIREQIIKGKLDKQFSSQVLMEQLWFKDETVKISDMVKELIRKTGENIVVRRFTRFALGE